MKIEIRCKRHGKAYGWPKLRAVDTNDQPVMGNDEDIDHWDLDLSDCYCPNEPSHHSDEVIVFEVWVCHE